MRSGAAEDYSLNKVNILMGFVNIGGTVGKRRRDLLDNLYLMNYHAVGVAELEDDVVTSLELSEKWHVVRALGLGVLVHKAYMESAELLDQHVTQSNKGRSTAIFVKVQWAGEVGGVRETVLSVFHVHHEHAKDGGHADPLLHHTTAPYFNRWVRDVAAKVLSHRVRVLMGDGNMSNYAVSKWFAAHKLTVNILAYHVEFKTTLDLNTQYETPRLPGSKVQLAKDLKYDSCGIFSVGPILAIRHQGPARHCLAAAVWPQREDVTGSTEMGFVQGSFRRVTPSRADLGYEDLPGDTTWSLPSLSNMVLLTCKLLKTKLQARADGDGVYRADEDLHERYDQERRKLVTLEAKPRAVGSDAEDRGWPAIHQSREFLSDPKKADPNANQWSKGGHWPLLVTLSLGSRSGRDRGPAGEVQRKHKTAQTRRWNETQIWPWWMESNTEGEHWGDSDRGGQWDGLFWRHAREGFLENKAWGSREEREKALEDYEAPWCSANGGIEALNESLAATEDAFQASLQRGETLESLSEAAEKRRLEIEEGKKKANEERWKRPRE